MTLPYDTPRCPGHWDLSATAPHILTMDDCQTCERYQQHTRDVLAVASRHFYGLPHPAVRVVRMSLPLDGGLPMLPCPMRRPA